MKVKKLSSLQGLRFFLFLPIFMIHAAGAFSFSITGWLAKCSVTGFFVLSGFLIAYQHGDDTVPCTWKSSFRYALDKVKKVYPLYLFSLFVALPVVVYYNIMQAGGSIIQQLKYLVLDLALVQSWSNQQSVAMTWNGVAWFLSSLTFCYFCAPTILKWLRKIKGWKSGWLTVVAIFAAQQLLWRGLAAAGLWMDPYIFPIYRIFDFAVGCAAGTCFLNIPKPQPKQQGIMLLLATAAELLVVVLCFAEVIIPEQWFVLPQVMLIFVFAWGKGLLSKALDSRPLQFLGGFGMELFLLHQPLIPYVGIINQKVVTIPLNFKAVLMIALDIAVAKAFQWARMKTVKKKEESIKA